MNQIVAFCNENIIGIIIMFAAGLFLIVKGGNLFVDAAGWLAEVSGIPRFIIGATVVSMATTLPELLTSLFATIDGNQAIAAAYGAITLEAQSYLTIAVGNAVGSVTANIGLIMGISLLCAPSVISRRQFFPQAFMMLTAAVVLCLFAPGGSIGLLPGIMLLVLFGIFMANNVRSAAANKKGAAENSPVQTDSRTVAGNILRFVLGAAGIVCGADMLVDYGSAIAEISGIPHDIVAVTMIAIGTSLPEFATALTAIAKKQTSLSVGNIIGANVFDLTLILPLCSFASGGRLTVNPSSYMIDLPVCFAVGLIAVLPPVFKGRFYRWQGVLLILVYAAYITGACFYAM